MVRIGIIGVGFMGYTHFEGAQKLKGGRVTAIATRDAKKRAGDWTSIQGNFGPRGGQVDLSQVKTYADYHELLADPDIDLVDVCLPTDMHEKVVLESLAAGKHTLVEKPISIDLKAADRMVAAAQKADRQLLVGQVLPFFPEFRYAAETIRGGKYGKLLAAHFRRVICPPDWSSEMSDFHRLGGWGIDLHIHDNHFIRMVCGAPQQVFSRGMLQDGFVNHVHTNYVYEDPNLAVTSVSGGIAAGALQFSHGFEIYLEKATLLYDAGTLGGEWVVAKPLTLVTKNSATQPKLKGGSEWYAAFTAELQAAVDSLKTGRQPDALSSLVARDALRICHAEAKSIAGGKPVKVG